MMKRLAIIILLFIMLFSTVCFLQENKKVTFYIKVFLQGPYKSNSMSDELNKENLIPLSQPYNRKPWNYNGKEHVTSIPKDVVDWILVELSDDTNKTEIISRQAAYLRTDGQVVFLDGISPVTFDNITEVNCFLIIQHRNHLPITSRSIIDLSGRVDYDFTLGNQKTLDNSLVNLGNNVFGMISGDSDSNGEINKLDYKRVSSSLLKVGYENADLDMNGVVNILDYKIINSNLLRKTVIR